MQSAWTKHLKTEEEKAKFAGSLFSAKLVLERQTEIIKEMERSANAVDLSISSYDSPSWAYKAADTNGYLRALRDIKQLNNLDQQKDN